MLPTEPQAKLFAQCDESELFRILIDTEICLATLIKYNERCDIVAFMPDSSVLLIDPNHENTSMLTAHYKNTTVLSYGKEWQIKIDHTVAPIAHPTKTPFLNGSIVMTTISGKGGRLESRSYLAVNNSRIPNLLVNLGGIDRMTDSNNYSFEFTSWSIIVPEISFEPLFLHQ